MSSSNEQFFFSQIGVFMSHLNIIPNAYAIQSYELEANNVNGDCKRIGGTWTTDIYIPNTCYLNFGDSLILNTGDSLTIDKGVTLVAEQNNIITVNYEATLNINGFVWENGGGNKISNTGYINIYQGGMIDLWDNALLVNNYYGGNINNYGTVNVETDEGLPGEIYNDGTFNDYCMSNSQFVFGSTFIGTQPVNLCSPTTITITPSQLSITPHQNAVFTATVTAKQPSAWISGTVQWTGPVGSSCNLVVNKLTNIASCKVGSYPLWMGTYPIFAEFVPDASDNSVYSPSSAHAQLDVAPCIFFCR
jgi:hypothetical protein